MIAKKVIFIILFLTFSASTSFAKIIFEFDGEKGYQFLGGENKHPGGGYFFWLGGYPQKPEGSGCSDTGAYHNSVLSNDTQAQGASPGSMFALKTPYSGSCPNEGYLRDTTVIKIPDSTELYVRWYQKWTGDWNSATVQQKFTKFYNPADASGTISMHFSFDSHDRTWRNYMYNVEDRFDMNGVTHDSSVWVYETRAAAGSQYTGVNRAWDDINNGLGSGGIDQVTTFQANRWYCIELHFKLNSNSDTADGESDAWVNGQKVFQVRNFKFYPNIYRSVSYSVNTLEFQHIYYNRSEINQPTYMDNIVVSDQYIGPFIPFLNPPQNLEIK
jgi:hypothetical protein